MMFLSEWGRASLYAHLSREFSLYLQRYVSPLESELFPLGYYDYNTLPLSPYLRHPFLPIHR